MTLILTEKPSVARAFVDALQVPRKGMYWENSEYCVVNALGHLLENFSPEDYDPSLKKWSLETLPIIPGEVKFKPVEKTKDQLAVVKKCFDNHRYDNFLLATDAEREGELIGDEILNYAGFTNYANARRFWVSEALTAAVILKGIENARPLADYSSYLDQGCARQHADWLVGMNLTRLVTLKSGKLLHFGRVQTAVLGAVYQREKSIQSFTPEKYSEVKAVLKGDSPFSVKLVNPDNSESPTRFPENSPALAEIAAEKDSMKTGVIIKLEKNKKTEHPPRLFNITGLQKEAHKKFGYSPEHTLEIAQSLYEKHKCLSYPRTPSRVMGDENVELVKGIYEKLIIKKGSHFELFEHVIRGSDPSLISSDNKRLFNSAELQDHHALIPLAQIPEECSAEEINVYFLVFKSFFNILRPPYIYNSVSVNADISGHKFIGSGIEVIQVGWKTEPDEDEEKQENFTGLRQDREYPVLSVSAEEKQTEPKKHYTFASLLQLMENPRGDDGKHLIGLGTPATRGSILQKLVDRKYVTLKGKNVLISGDGEFLIENIKKNEGLFTFISIGATTIWEEKLHNDTASFLDGIKNFIRDAVKNTGMETYQREKVSLGKCPLCGADVYEGKKSYYCGNYKADCKFSIWKEICGASVSPTDAQALLAGKQTKVKKCVSGKSGKEFKAAFKLEKDKIVFAFDDNIGKK